MVRSTRRTASLRHRRSGLVAVAALVALLAGPLAAAPAWAAETPAAPLVEALEAETVSLAWAAIDGASDYAVVEHDAGGEIGAFSLGDPEQARVEATASADDLVRAAVTGLEPGVPRAYAIRGLDDEGAVIAETGRTALLTPPTAEVAEAPEEADASEGGVDSGTDAGADQDADSGSDPDAAPAVDADVDAAVDADAAAAGDVGSSRATRAAGEPQQVTNVMLEWGINDESNGGAYFGGCNFLSAGTAGNTGSARLWTQADGFYRTEDGNTTIVKPTADGTSLTQPTWATKCQTPAGQSVNGKATSAPDSHTRTRVQIAGGTGTIDPATGTAAIAWTGSFTVAYYGGMTYWSATDPILTVDADGTGEVTATLSGYGTDMDDTSLWEPIAGRQVVLAELSGVEVTASGFVVTPDFLGVAIPAEIAGRNAQAVRTDDNAAWWGAFPADFLRFQELTGQNSYWYTTDGGATSLQPRKVTLPLTIEVGASTPTPVAPAITSHPQSASVDAGATASFTVAASGRPLHYQWQVHDAAGWTTISGATAATLAVPATAALDGARYRAVVSNDLGSATSRSAQLTVRTSGGGDDGDGGDGDGEETGPTETSGALFDWGINAESTGGAYFGGCNFLSAGVAGDAGSARVWTQADGFYRSTAGNTTIVRATADGEGLERPTWATKCETAGGTSVNGKTTSGADSHTGARVRITGGTGTFDADANTADISWRGSFTVAYYGGMTYWSASDPRLVVREDGTGTVTATLSGYASDMDDASKWGRIAPRTVVIATLTGVEVTAAGFTRIPDYLGVSIPGDIAGRNVQPARTADNREWWGAFPADFVRFQTLTGQSSYWYTTAGGAGSIQPRKVPLALTVCATASCDVPEAEAAGGTDSPTIRQTALKPPTARLWTAAPQAALPPQTVNEVLLIKRVAAAPPATAAAIEVDERVLVAAGALVAMLALLVLVAGAGGVLVLTGAPRK